MDIDIDTPTTFNPANYFSWPRASILRDGALAPHPCGVYPQKMAVDPTTGLAAIPYDHAEEVGFFKIDFLHLGVYDKFSSRQEIDALLEIEPDWSLLTNSIHQQKLFQLSKHGDVLDIVKPTSVEELADVLALIRPGKRNLVKLYMTHRNACRTLLYSKDESGYSFKKSHAVAYALVIVLQLHLISTNNL